MVLKTGHHHPSVSFLSSEPHWSHTPAAVLLSLWSCASSSGNHDLFSGWICGKTDKVESVWGRWPLLGVHVVLLLFTRGFHIPSYMLCTFSGVTLQLDGQGGWCLAIPQGEEYWNQTSATVVGLPDNARWHHASSICWNWWAEEDHTKLVVQCALRRKILVEQHLGVVAEHLGSKKSLNKLM